MPATINPQGSGKERFEEGCCLDASIERPQQISKESVPDDIMLEALHCAANNQFIGGAQVLADSMGTGDSLTVAYYYGRFLPQQTNKALTIAVYSKNGKRGTIFDIGFSNEGRGYSIENLPALRKKGKTWRVGEINGGLWSYTRLYYLAQEIGARPRRTVSLRAIADHIPDECWVMYSKQEIGSKTPTKPQP